MRRTLSSIDTAMQCSKQGILPTGIEAGHRLPQVLIELCSAARGFRIYNIQIYQKLTHGFWLAEAGRTNAACLDALNAKNWIPKEASKSADLAIRPGGMSRLVRDRLRFANTEFGAPGCGGRPVQTRDGGAKFPEKQQREAAPARQQAFGRLRRPQFLPHEQCGGVSSASSGILIVG